MHTPIQQHVQLTHDAKIIFQHNNHPTSMQVTNNGVLRMHRTNNTLYV